MACIQEVDFSEQREIDSISTNEQFKTTQRQSMRFTAASGEEKKPQTFQLLKRESRPNEPKQSRQEIKIQRLQDIIVSQDEKTKNLERQLAEAIEVLWREKEAKKELFVKVNEQKQEITKQQLQARQFKREMKQNKREKEEAITQFSKAEFDKSDLTAMLRSLNEEGSKINLTLKEERSKNEKQTRQLEEAQNKACELENENVHLHYEVAKLQLKVDDLKSEEKKLQDINFAMAFEHEEQKAILESEIDDYKACVDECKTSLKKATTNLVKTKKENKTLSQRLRNYKAKSERRAKIIQVDKETKAEMKETIEALKKENEILQAQLNTGFIGRYRSLKRFFVRVVDALLSPF
ncbi:uncharacterized protein LOC144631819 isoform X1 [Oculina patagonica]